MIEIKGRVALVTGGGSGIGRALALALAGEGASVVIADILPDNAQVVAAEINNSGGAALAVGWAEREALLGGTARTWLNWTA